MLRRLVLSVIAVTLCVAYSKAKDEGQHKHLLFSHSYQDVEVMSRKNLGTRLWLQLRHGPSKSSGWIYPVGYPEFFITNGEDSAEMELRYNSKRKCFCKGEWWIKTNGYVQVVREIVRRPWHCECGHTEYQYITNTYSIGQSEVKK